MLKNHLISHIVYHTNTAIENVADSKINSTLKQTDIIIVKNRRVKISHCPLSCLVFEYNYTQYHYALKKPHSLRADEWVWLWAWSEALGGGGGGDLLGQTLEPLLQLSPGVGLVLQHLTQLLRLLGGWGGV